MQGNGYPLHLFSKSVRREYHVRDGWPKNDWGGLDELGGMKKQLENIHLLDNVYLPRSWLEGVVILNDIFEMYYW
jgi:hypothetical protein